MTQVPSSFAQFLLQLRKRAGLTQHDLAVATGYTAGLISHLEQGRRLPDVATVAQVFVPALHLQAEPQLATRLIELAALAHGDGAMATDLLPSVPLNSLNGNAATHGESKQHVPVAPTQLLGRTQELKTIIAHFSEGQTRLLTLIGPPGVGKTRLALEALSRLHPFFADGGSFVALAAVSTPDLLAAAIVDGLQIKDSGASQPMQRLIRYLRHKGILLVLDNFEQLLAAPPSVNGAATSQDKVSAASLLAELLSECPKLHLLVTSRERLHLRAEHRQRVPPLTLADAVELFIQRAKAVQPLLRLTKQNQEAIEALCRHLDCLPLALELVAVQTEHFTPKQLLTRLQQRGLDLLNDGPHDLPVRQRTLRTAIGSSYELLTHEEQRLFCVLSIFVGGFDREAVEALGFAEATLRSLVNKSLVSSAPVEYDEPRYLILETLHSYATEQLLQHANIAQLRKSYAEYFVTMAENLGPYQTTVHNKYWFRRFLVDYDNVRSALEWALEQAEVEIALRFIWPLRWFLCLRSDYYMIAFWARKAVAVAEAHLPDFCTLAPEEITPHIARLSDWLARAWYCITSVSVDPDELTTSLARSLALNRLMEPNDLTPTLIDQLVGLEADKGNIARSNELLWERLRVTETLRTVPEHVRKNQMAWGTYSQGISPLNDGKFEQARQFFEQSIQLFAEIGQTFEIAIVHRELGETALYLGDMEQAQKSYDYVVKEFENDQGQFETRLSRQEILFAVHRKQWQRAQDLLLQEIRQFPVEEAALLTYNYYILCLTTVIANKGEHVQATTLFGATDALLRKCLSLPPIYQTEYDAARTLTQSHLAPTTFEAAYARGAAMDAKALLDFIMASFSSSSEVSIVS